VTGVSDDLRADVEARVRGLTSLGNGRAVLDIAPDADPWRVMHDLGDRGLKLVSLNPVRETLEDYFVQIVKGAEPRRSGGH